jgi:SPX domain protein involved in polyphosphate accumulation
LRGGYQNIFERKTLFSEKRVSKYGRLTVIGISRIKKKLQKLSNAFSFKLYFTPVFSPVYTVTPII